jgi:hypothetical protein
MRRRAIPITYSRTQTPNLTQCDLIRQFRDTARDTQSKNLFLIGFAPRPFFFFCAARDSWAIRFLSRPKLGGTIIAGSEKSSKIAHSSVGGLYLFQRSLRADEKCDGKDHEVHARKQGSRWILLPECPDHAHGQRIAPNGSHSNVDRQCVWAIER